ncbi:MAG TPA: hypothetical protein DGD08_11435 [Gemmatimonas aurantiaca]|uniref:Uncharacterized protein n=2 Tax=Gemmatimonas aurantiaca TaxID=173480 RepID=C1ACG0_GEMAT|nr:hypothetical protein [Gemmatimonas aurantiaca]BAH40187.1 hypothetical protein GAU_3145 [Gemmatimonas aurantiaca T-27]HCT57803.1 hypothetical protein [Gemmatimonas aurantiaca]
MHIAPRSVTSIARPSVPITGATILSAIALLLAMPSTAWAQSTAMPQIGTISGGNTVLLESRTVKRTPQEITATLRVPFLKPAKVPGGEWFGSRTLVAVRCAEGTVAVKENRYYADAKFAKVANERIVKIPGYAAPVPGSVPAVAMAHLCKPAKP